MLTKTELLQQLKQFSSAVGRPVLVHTSLKAIGEIEGGAQTLLDCLIEYFTQAGGLLCIPAHTWGFDTMDMITNRVCIGVLPYTAACDPRGTRSLHPTHSMTVFGEPEKAAAFIADEPAAMTPAPPNGCYGKVCAMGGSILLIGVGHDSDTYLHCVEEMLDVPNRLDPEPRCMKMIYPDGHTEERLVHGHKTVGMPLASYQYPKYEAAFRYHSVITDGIIGNAKTQLCSAQGMRDVMRLIRERSGGAELLSDHSPLDPAFYEMTALDRARSIFQHDIFATERAGIVIDAVGDHYAKCSMKVEVHHKNAAGAVMGGALFTLADFAFAVASNLGQSLTVTTTSNISFVGICKGDILYAETRLIKDGKRSCFFEITITDDLGNLVAVVTSNGMHLEKKI